MPQTGTQPLRERSQIGVQDTWDLSRLFSDDAAWEQALTALPTKVDAVSAYAGRLKDAGTIRAYLDAATDLSRALSDLYCYASMRHSEDTRDETAQSMYARIGAQYARAAAALSFAEPEILALPEETLRALTEENCLEPYRFTLEALLRQKPHTLTAGEEKLLASFGEALGAPSDIAEALRDADMTFAPVRDGQGREVELNGANYILLQTSPDRTLRKNSFAAYYAAFRDHIHTFASAYAGAVKAAAAEAAVRGYSSSRAMAMAGENIPEAVYDNLVGAVRAHLPEMYRYLALRKRLLGVEELHYYDVYAPLTGQSPARYTYDQARQMVLAAVAPLGEAYCAQVRQGFERRWVDVYPNKGKSGGAYSTGTYDSEPYILTNFTGTLDSVSTLAHEMGHSMHSWLANHAQPPQYAGYTLFVAEVASTVNENLMIEQLLKGENDPAARLVLLNQYLENFKGTVFRQTMFAEFERDAHAMYERGEALGPGALNALYRRLVRDYFGPGLVLDGEVELEWARIPHFYRPFYVYKYATGYSAAVALSEAVLHQGDKATKRYLEFLSMGGSAWPLDELRHAGVDLLTPQPVDAALQNFARLLDDAERCAQKLGL